MRDPSLPDSPELEPAVLSEAEVASFIQHERRKTPELTDVLVPSVARIPFPPLPEPITYGTHPVTQAPLIAYPAYIFGRGITRDQRVMNWDDAWILRWFDSQLAAEEAHLQHSLAFRDANDAGSLWETHVLRHLEMPPNTAPSPYQKLSLPPPEELMTLVDTPLAPYRVRHDVDQFYESRYIDDDKWGDAMYSDPIPANTRHGDGGVLEICRNAWNSSTIISSILTQLGIDPQNLQDIIHEIERREREYRKSWNTDVLQWIHSLTQRPSAIYFDMRLQKRFTDSHNNPSDENLERAMVHWHALAPEFTQQLALAERLRYVEQEEQIFVNWKATRGTSYVLRPDGTRRSLPVGEQVWPIIAADELALVHEKDSNAAPHQFAAYPPKTPVSPEQIAAVHALEQAIAAEWDGRRGFSSGKVSPPVGKGWNIAQYTSMTPENMQTLRNTLIAKQVADKQWNSLLPGELSPPPPSHEPTFSEIRDGRRTAEKNAAQKATNAIARKAEFTPEVQQEINRELQHVSVFLALCNALSQDTEEKKKFVSAIQKIYRHLHEQLASNQLGKDSVFRQITSTLEQFESIASRPKIKIEIPKLWEKIGERIAEWKGIPTLIHQHENAQYLINDEKIITVDDFIERVSEAFLKDPWNTSVEKLIDDECLSLL